MKTHRTFELAGHRIFYEHGAGNSLRNFAPHMADYGRFFTRLVHPKTD